MSRPYSVADVSFVLDLSERRVQELASELTPPPPKHGGAWLFYPIDLDRLRRLHASKQKYEKRES